MLLKRGFVQNIIVIFIVLIITVPTMLYFLNQSDFHGLNSFSPPIGYDTGNVQIPSPSPLTGMANPASVFCKKQGGTSKNVKNSDGSQSGNCIFYDGSYCEEWAYFRKECVPGVNPAPVKK